MKKNIKKRVFLSIIIILLFVFIKIWLNGSFLINKKINIKQGDNFQTFLNNLNYLEQLKIKLNIKLSGKEIPKISIGSYTFSGDYNTESFLKTIKKGPIQEYIKYTILEGRSIYDIDYDLSKKGYINSGNFLKYLELNTKKIIGQYPFLSYINNQHKLTTLEGFLYPDTYNIDKTKPFIKQLLQHQLNTFENKIWKKYGEKIKKFSQKLKNDGYKNLKLSPWAIITLASIIQKEERNINNKPIIAGIFINRLSKGIQLGADITLCYGLKLPYKQCPPSIIIKNIKNKKNKYNTRIRGGLTPTPISNPTKNTILSILNYKKTNYLYYLHDNNGNIHFGKNLKEHNINKNLYIK